MAPAGAAPNEHRPPLSQSVFDFRILIDPKQGVVPERGAQRRARRTPRAESQISHLRSQKGMESRDEAQNSPEEKRLELGYRNEEFF
ncbi:MAG: hypothetical protein JWM16_797 [Verrucomicrobiales bacterium]|nr:hypothetical protein [Verrucomicrobiales bacterium]